MPEVINISLGNLDSSLVFIELFNFSFFGISGWGIHLDYCNIEWFALETSRDHSVIFEIAPKYWEACMQVKKQQLELDLKQWTGKFPSFQIGKGVCQGCILSSCLFHLYAETIMWKTRLDEAQAGIKIAGRNIKNLTMQMTPSLWQKAKRN